MDRKRIVRMRPLPLAALLTLASATAASADPILSWVGVLLAPADQPGSSPAPTTPPTPSFADIAGPAKTVSLIDLLQLAVKQSPALAQAKLNIEIALAQIEQSQAWSETAFSAHAEGATSYVNQTDARRDHIDLSASISKALSTGGSLGLTLGGGWSRDPSFEILNPDVEVYSSTATATFTQPLLNGRGESVMRAAERVAATQRDAYQVAARGTAINTVRDVVLAYLNLVAAERDLDIRRSSLQLAIERQRVTQDGIRGGGVARAELIPVEQAIATREEDILAGELMVLDRSLALRQLVQLPISSSDQLLASTGDLTIPASQWQQDQLVEEALAHSPELARLKALEAGATIEVEVAENGVLPSLDLALSFGPSGFSDTAGGAIENMTGFDQYAASGSLDYSTTWGRRAAKANLRDERAQRETIRVSAVDVRSQVIEAMSRAVAQVNVAERRHKIAIRAVDLAEQNLQVEKDRLALGKSRNVEVLIRQDELRAAQLRTVNAIIDWHRAATVISALTGDILPKYGIELR